jgi:D-ribose pyranose/furanose isomerase RbsD
MSEWLKVMLDEIARKKAEAELARAEEERRRTEQQRKVVVESGECAPRKNIGDAE